MTDQRASPADAPARTEEERAGDSYVERRRAARSWGAEKGAMYRQYMKTSVSGLEIGLSVAFGAGLGFWADTAWGTKPWGTLIGLVIGIAHSVKLIVMMSKKAMMESQGDEESAEPAPGFDDDEDAPNGDPAEGGDEDDRRRKARGSGWM